MRHGSAVILVLIAVSVALSWACEEYDPPPEVVLEVPEGGAYIEGSPLQIFFSEPVEAGSLVVEIWPNERGPEGELMREAEPYIVSCSVGSCEGAELVVSEDRTQATLLLQNEAGTAGPSRVLRVQPGLSDLVGRSTQVPYEFDYVYRFVLEPPVGGDGGGNMADAGGIADDVGETPVDPVDFRDGVYILNASVTQPIPVVLNLVADIQATPTGSMRIVAAYAKKSEGRNAETLDPKELNIVSDDTGWSIFGRGEVLSDGSGRRAFQTEQFDITIPTAFGEVALTGVRINAQITPGEGERDRIEGTLSYQKVTLNGEGVINEPSSTPLVAQHIGAEPAPAGYPEVCGDVCGAVSGFCKPPADFPGAGFCAAAGD